MIWLLLYPLLLLKKLLAGWLQRLFKYLLKYDTFRIKVIYPKLGIQYDKSIKRTIDRPILHAEVDGGKYNLPVFANQTRIDDLRRSRLREDDVLVVTYPKSGTHLCGYIVKLLAEKRSKIMQDPMVLPFYELIKQSELDSVPSTTQRILKSHLPLSLLPPCADTSVQNKIIFCLRDPKDACVSYYKFTLGLEVLTGPVYESFDDWVELWLLGCVDYGDWFDFVLPYWEQRHRENFLFVTYEDILQDPETVIVNIAKFLGYTTSRREVEDIKEKIKFSNMKQMLEKSAKGQGTNLMREGKTGSSKKAFNERQHFLFNRMFKERMAGKEFNVYDYE